MQHPEPWIVSLESQNQVTPLRNCDCVSDRRQIHFSSVQKASLIQLHHFDNRCWLVWKTAHANHVKIMSMKVDWVAELVPDPLFINKNQFDNGIQLDF